MVSYQRFVSLFFSEIDADSQEQAQDAMSRASTVWNKNKEALQAATVQEVRQELQDL